MAETAEYLDATLVEFELDFLEDQFRPLVEAVPDMLEDALVRARAAKFIGACIANREISLAPEALGLKPIESLHQAIQQAANGDERAKQMVTTNVATDVIERTIKTGHVMQIALEVDETGRIQQFGQHLETVQANTLRLASDNWQKLERSKAEATNSFRLHELYKNDKLQDYSFVVLSRAADNMSLAQMNDEGFFTDTMSMAIQVTSQKNNALITETAFVAGVSEPNAKRHDAETVVALAELLGVDLHGKSAAEIIDTPLLVHNSLLLNGVIDLVAIYDNCAGGTFFGQTKPRQNYLQYQQQCQAREAQLQPVVAAIVEELIAEAASITGPVHATQRLNKLSGRRMVQQAMFDDSIDPRVFGPAAEHVIAGRLFFEQGDIEAGLAEAQLAVQTEQSRSCPGGSGGQNETEEKIADCEFVSKKCPVCGEANAKTKVSDGHFYHVGRKCRA